MKKILFLLLSLLFIFACENSRSGGINPSDGIEEFTVNFSVDGKMGGTILAKIKGDKSINPGAKVAKDDEVVFTAIPSDDTYSIASWTLDGDFVNGTQAEYLLKITKNVNVVVRFEENGGLKNINIEKVVLGYPNISDSEGKEVKGEELNENTIIPDFEVPRHNFPIHVWHKTEFTIEKVYVTYQGKKKEINGEISKTFFVQDYSLVENVKTPFIIDIEGEGYKSLKLTFNVTYKNVKVKYMDDITIIGITKNKDKQITFGFVGDKHIDELVGGKSTIDVSSPNTIISILTERKGGEQPKLEMKLDNSVMQGIDFEAGSYFMETQLSNLTVGVHNIKIKIEKEGWIPGNYDFNIKYKPRLSFKSLTINGNAYTEISKIKKIELEKNATNPVTISGEVIEDGAIISFKKLENKKYVDFTPPLEVEEGKTISCRMYASLDGYTTTYYGFKLIRKTE